ncbi:DUF192 domain-containing protein [Gemmatimonadota bacterium]
MRIINRERRTLVGSNVQVADTWMGRARGYLGRPAPAQGDGILLIPCTAIHTFGMTFDLDVLFLDDEGRVLEALRGFPPWRRTKRVAGARYVLEVPSGTIEATATEVGDVLSWHLPRQVPVPGTPASLREGRRASNQGKGERKSA